MVAGVLAVVVVVDVGGGQVPANGLQPVPQKSGPVPHLKLVEYCTIHIDYNTLSHSVSCAGHINSMFVS